MYTPSHYTADIGNMNYVELNTTWMLSSLCDAAHHKSQVR